MSAISGVRLGTGRGGISGASIYEGRDDVLVMEFAPGSTVAGIFTQNGFRAPPVSLAERRLAAGSVRAFLVNAGNANAATGDEGLRRAEASCRMLADRLGIEEASVLPFSTGVIGEQLHLEAMRVGIFRACEDLSDLSWGDAARAILTTDTRPKLAVREVEIGADKVHIRGIAKGSGMIAPKMATMLAFVATDARIDQGLLDERLPKLGDLSFNRVTVDGDTSTNDACMLVATGASGVEIGADAKVFWKALEGLMKGLARAVVEDAEGGHKVVRIVVQGGLDRTECARVARCIAESPLVRTAIFAEDPNWGRICMAIGNAGLDQFDPASVDVFFDKVQVMVGGMANPALDEEEARLVMQKKKYAMRVKLGRGKASSEMFTSDLSHEYVTINAEYRT